MNLNELAGLFTNAGATLAIIRFFSGFACHSVSVIMLVTIPSTPLLADAHPGGFLIL